MHLSALILYLRSTALNAAAQAPCLLAACAAITVAISYLAPSLSTFLEVSTRNPYDCFGDSITTRA